MERLQFLDILKQKMQCFNVDNLFEILVYFVIGFVLGSVIKYSARYFLWFLIFSIISLWAVQNLGVVSIKYEYLRELFHMTEEYTISDLLKGLVDFVQSHIAESISLIFGIYLSWEIL